jgi:hypothetical protein
MFISVFYIYDVSTYISFINEKITKNKTSLSKNCEIIYRVLITIKSEKSQIQ